MIVFPLSLKRTKGPARAPVGSSDGSVNRAYATSSVRISTAQTMQSALTYGTWRRLRSGRSSVFRGGRTVVAHTHNNTTESGSNSLTLLPRSVRRDFGVQNSTYSTFFIRRSVLKSFCSIHFSLYKF